VLTFKFQSRSPRPLPALSPSLPHSHFKFLLLECLCCYCSQVCIRMSYLPRFATTACCRLLPPRAGAKARLLCRSPTGVCPLVGCPRLRRRYGGTCAKGRRALVLLLGLVMVVPLSVLQVVADCLLWFTCVQQKEPISATPRRQVDKPCPRAATSRSVHGNGPFMSTAGKDGGSTARRHGGRT
jgi:hypothetical protein